MMWSTIWRNGRQLGFFNRIEYWDFGFQQNTPKNVVVKPGDRINTHCVYNQDPSRIVPFATPSNAEMCIEYVFYYPKLAGSFCAFYYNARNLTYCLNAPLGTSPNYPYNPSLVDPTGGLEKQFGKLNASYVCPYSPQTTQSPSTQATVQTTSNPSGPCTYSFVKDVYPILEQYASAGHFTGGSATGFLNLGSTADQAYQALVNVGSTQSSLKLVQAKSRTTSYLWHKISGTQLSVSGSGGSMPYGSPLLPQATREIIGIWIDEGAVKVCQNTNTQSTNEEVSGASIFTNILIIFIVVLVTLF